MELLGSDYVISHFVSCVNAKREQDLLWAYVTDTLNTIAGNTRYHLVYTRNGAEAVEIGGKFEKRWAEIARPPKDKPEPEAEDNRTVADFINQIWGAIEGTEKGGG